MAQHVGRDAELNLAHIREILGNLRGRFANLLPGGEAAAVNPVPQHEFDEEDEYLQDILAQFPDHEDGDDEN